MDNFLLKVNENLNNNIIIKKVDEKNIYSEDSFDHIEGLFLNNKLDEIYKDQNSLDEMIKYFILSDLNSNKINDCDGKAKDMNQINYYSDLLIRNVSKKDNIKKKYKIESYKNSVNFLNINYDLKNKYKFGLFYFIKREIEKKNFLTKILFIPSNKFRVNSRIVELNKSLIMGITNCTPDSLANAFLSNKQNLSEKYCNESFIQEITNKDIDDEDKYDLMIKILKKNKNNIDIIDIGGESTRPDSQVIEENEEFKRVEKLISRIRKDEELKDVIISVDTRKVKKDIEYKLVIENIILN